LNLRCRKIPSIVAIVLFPLFISPQGAMAVTKVSGNYFLEETRASGPQGSTSLTAGGVNFNIEPQTRKNLHLRFSVPLSFEVRDGERNWRTSPIGNFAADMAGEWFTLNLQYGRFVTISSAAQLTESTSSSAAYSLVVPDLPRLSLNYIKTETTTAGVSSEAESYSVFSDYRYKWLNFRAGHFASTTASERFAPSRSSSLLLGMGGSYEILPMTVFSFDDDFNRVVSGSSGGVETASTTNALRLGANSRPFEWLGFGAGFFRTENRFESGSTAQQTTDLSTSVYPSRNLTFSASTGNRRFTDAGAQRSVDYSTVGAAFSDWMTETVRLGLNASRSYNTDPSQGKDISDNYGANALMNVAPRVTAVAALSVNRSENRQFVSEKGYDAFGTLAERAQFDDRPAGFTFFDTVNNDLYTKNSLAFGDWSLPLHVEPITKRNGVSKNVQVNMAPTDKTSMSLSYSTNFSSDRLDLSGTGSKTWRGFLAWMPTRRVNMSIYGTVNVSERGNRSNAASTSLSYRFFRGHQLTMNYSRQESLGKTVDAYSGTLGLTLGRRTSMQIVYAATQPGREDETTFLKAGISQSF
jgi:hypothetical protein